MSETLEEQVQKIVVSMDKQENPKQVPEIETAGAEEIQDIYVLIVRERAEPEEDVIHSTLVTQKTEPIDPLMYATGIFFVSLVMCCIALQVLLMLNPPIAAVTIFPKAQQISLNATLPLGRVLSPLTLSLSKTTPTTGKGHQDAKHAIGAVTFYNGLFTRQTVSAGTLLTASNGTQITTDQDAIIPAANPPNLGQTIVSAHAMQTGSRGNIAAYDIDTPCCLTAVKAVNRQAFYAGQDARNFQTVAKSDIDNTAIPLKTTLAQSMQGALQGQLKPNEQLHILPCTHIITSDHQIDHEATQVKVAASLACSAITYNTADFESKVTQLLTNEALKQVGSGYSLLGTVQVSVKEASVTHTTSPTVFLSFHAFGTWVYAIDKAEREHMKSLMKGRTKQEALQILQSLPGIEKASIAWDENTKLPGDSRYIHIVLILLQSPSLQGR